MSEPPSRFAGDSDEDLLAYMAMKEDPSRHGAGAEFYSRHKGFVFGVLRKNGFDRLVGGEEGLCDVVQETFARAYERAASYEPCGSDDAARQRRGARRWVVGVARNVIRDTLSRSVSVTPAFSLDESIEFPEVLIPTEGESMAARLVGEVLEQLSDREQNVLRATMMFYKPGEKHQRMPNSAAAGLAAELSTTPENIRMIRKRALEKIRVRLEAYFSAKQEVRT